MLIVMMGFLIVIASSMLLMKRNKETFYLFSMCVSLFMMLLGTFIYIAKKGGISKELQNFFFINGAIKYKFQYMLIQLNQLGFLIAIGRYLFPMFLLLLALHYTANPLVKRMKWIRYVAVIVPVLTLVVYYPPIFRFVTEKNLALQTIIMNITLGWMSLFVIAAVFLLIMEARSIQLKIFQRNFLLILTFILSLVTLYLLYFIQDPAHVYRFYGNYLQLTGRIFYLKSVVSIQLYVVIVCLNTVAAIIGFASMYRYTRDAFTTMRHGEMIKYQTEAVATSTSTFVHGMKNQLLTNQVIHKRIGRLQAEGKVPAELTAHIDELEQQNDMMLKRMDELRQTIQTNHVHLHAHPLAEMIHTSYEQIQSTMEAQDIKWEAVLDDSLIVLADKQHLTEALNNMFVNACEAIAARKQALVEEKSLATYVGKLTVKTYRSRMYHVVEITDNGIGMTKRELKRIDEPFYSRKNSTNNWGMGLYYVRKIIEEHFGLFRYESEKNVGSTFYIFLPKYKI